MTMLLATWLLAVAAFEPTERPRMVVSLEKAEAGALALEIRTLGSYTVSLTPTARLSLRRVGSPSVFDYGAVVDQKGVSGAFRMAPGESLRLRVTPESLAWSANELGSGEQPLG